jgi:hypothetical protein
VAEAEAVAGSRDPATLLLTKEALMSEWIDPRHAQTMARFRQAQAATAPKGCVPCRGYGVQNGTSCRACDGTGEQRPVRAFITT